MEKMKILHIITRLDRGGSAQNTILTVRGLGRMPGAGCQIPDAGSRMADTGYRIPDARYQIPDAGGRIGKYEMTLVTGSVEDVDVTGINLVIIPELSRGLNPIKDILCLIKLYNLIKTEKPDIVHTHSSKAGFLGRVAAKLASSAIWHLASGHRHPAIIYTPHGHIFYGYFNLVITQIFILLERFTAKFTDKIICLTDGEMKDLLKFGISKDRGKFLTIHSGIDLERFKGVKIAREKKRRELGISENSVVIISHTRLVPIKGHKYIIEAAERVAGCQMPGTGCQMADIRFIFVGGGGLKSKLEIEVEKLGLKGKILFLGERDDIPELLTASDIFVTAPLNEGMGRAIVEAMACGLPVVATSVCGIPDVVKDGVTGILVSSGDIDGLANAMLTLIKDPSLREKMGEEGRKRAELFGVEGMVGEIDRLYAGGRIPDAGSRMPDTRCR